MRNNKFFGAIHAFMFCAFFISFMFRTDTYPLWNAVSAATPFWAPWFNAESLFFTGAGFFLLWLAVTWNLRRHWRLFLILLLTAGSIVLWFFELSFFASILITAALSAAMPLAVGHERFEPVRIFWALLAVILTACFPNIGYCAAGVVLAVIISQREIAGMRFGGRIVLAFMMLTALFLGASPLKRKAAAVDVTAEHFRQNYELMMLAYAQYGAIPGNTLCYFNHPWQNMRDLSAIVTKLSVGKNENMPAYFAGDQLRFAAEHALFLQGKSIPPPAAPQKNGRPAIILVSYPATADYRRRTGRPPYFGDAWRNYSFYTLEGLTGMKAAMSKNGVLAMQLPPEQEHAASILAAIRKVFKHSVTLRWSGVYVFASDRELTVDHEVLDQNAVTAGIYKYMYAPYRILNFALSTFHEPGDDARLARAAADASPAALRDLPRINTKDSIVLHYVENVFRRSMEFIPWILAGIFLIYCFCRYWYAGVPGAKLPFSSFETGVITGVTVFVPILSYSMIAHVPIYKIITGPFVALFAFSVMIMTVFVQERTAKSFPVRMLMAVLCFSAFFDSSYSRTMLCCIALLAGIAAVCAGHCPRRCNMSAWFAGMAAACLLTPVLWFSKSLFYPAAVVIFCYIIFADYAASNREKNENTAAHDG